MRPPKFTNKHFNVRVGNEWISIDFDGLEWKITSSTPKNKAKKNWLDGQVGLVYSHILAGVDVMSESYVKGLELALEDIVEY
jgi:hypothetical protein